MSTAAEIKAFATKYGIKNVNLIQTQPLINGKWVTPAKAETFAVDDPATGDHLLHVTNTPVELVEQSIKDAKVAFDSFKKTTGRYRGDLLKKLHALMVENAEDLAKLNTIENGKALPDSRGEIKYGYSFFEWFSEEAPRINGDNISSADPNRRIITYKQPVGVVGILTPWNFPTAMITRKMGAAIAAGCTAVVKPATETPLSALAIGYLAQQAGFPPGVFNLLPVDNDRTKIVGSLFCESKLIKKVSFTGSTGVGKSNLCLC
ncbi:unnamed protein product [Ambrosiozyma monospora]|uniref:Unnamed protein product n=1 Tax=Ambrosiozyma monospora TaxID=43982 RepID=A0ACB5TTQ1_AMBMO|nr:unnamed protein product [Ambrosiozyma monospora]